MSGVAMPSLYGNMIHRSETIVLTRDNHRLPEKHCTDVRMRDLRWLARRLYPRRLRNQMIMMAILMVIIPTISIGYIVETEGRSAVLSEKEKKLSSVITLLNDALGDRFSHYPNLPREARIRALNQELAPITERITQAFPGIGAGYYHKALDAIITYAPSALYQGNVGITITEDHPGREVMSSNAPVVYSGRQVRGDILNSMIPIARQGRGYWVYLGQ